MGKFAGIRVALMCMALLMVCSCCMAAGDVWESSIGQGDVRVIPQAGCGAGGTCFSIQLFAPGPIISIEFRCKAKGDACSRIHPCPDSDKCATHKKEFEITGPSAMFWAWTDSADPMTTYNFKIRYQYP